MQKKTLNMEIWDILGYDSEDYRDLIREAGFDPDELYEDFGCFVEELDNPSSRLEFKKERRDFYYWLERKSDFNENGEQINEAMELLKSTGEKFGGGLQDSHLAILYDKFQNERGVVEKN